MTIATTPTLIEPLHENVTKSSPDLHLSATEHSPPLSTPVLRMSVSEGTVIPRPLVTALDAAYLFHLLARDPQKVVAPGKSLLSVVSELDQRATSGSEKSVRKVVHRAFWDQALEVLSSPLPSSQISRLKGLYKDLHEALEPLFPSKHPALVKFSFPLPPTSSPLLSAIAHLRDALVTLHQRCAPVRDATIDDILHQIHHRSPSASTEELAELLVNVIRSVLDLSIDMRNDYSNAVLATASEQELVDMMAEMAETQEQGLILQLWESKEVMRKAWTGWMEGFRPAEFAISVQPNKFWILKLVESLGKPHAIASNLVAPSRFREITSDSDHANPGAGTKRVSEPQNMLPPQFLFSGPALFSLQNSIQALTILASLKSLVPTARTAPSPSQSGAYDSTSPVNSFTERIWALLESEISETDDGSLKTKIINLADEVVMTHINALPLGVTTLDARLEQTLRSTVDRILRADDPVFVLLQKRLLAAFSAALLGIPVVDEPVSVRMRSGRFEHQRAISSSPPTVPQSVQREVAVVAKGFEDPVIAKQCSITALTLRRSIEWVDRVWSDTMPY